MTISNWMAVLGLVNGTTGGVVLVLPIIGLDAGWLMIPVLILIASLCSYYTATLMFVHLGKSKTINKSIMNHFSNHKYCQFYNLTIFASFFGEMILYFDLLVSESQGCLFFVGESFKPWVPYLVAVLLIILVLITRLYHFEDKLLGYGILSMLVYAMFIAWIIITRKQGQKSLPMVEGAFVDLGAAMSQGFSIHNMMIPIVLRAQDPQDYKKILGKIVILSVIEVISQMNFQVREKVINSANVFTIGAILYTFIAYGSVALVNRVPLNGVGQTVEDYFTYNEWEIYLLGAIYIINILTVFPEFISVSKCIFLIKRIRFFNLFSEEDCADAKLRLREIVYLLVVVGVCLVSKILNFRAPLVIQLNGSIICFTQIYLIPISIHLKCIWQNHTNKYQSQYAIQHVNFDSNTNQLKHVEYHKENNGDVDRLNQQFKDQIVQSANPDIPQPLNDTITKQCPFHEELASDKHLGFSQVVKSIIVLFYGLFVMTFTFYTIFFKKES